jgi:hypothetical protein
VGQLVQATLSAVFPRCKNFHSLGLQGVDVLEMVGDIFQPEKLRIIPCLHKLGYCHSTK